MKHFTRQLLNDLSKQARQSERKRKNHNFHEFPEDTLQRMLNALEPGTYIQPHKHENPDKREAFIILKGKILIVEYDDEGNIRDHVIAEANGINFGAEVAAGIWHSVICLTPGTVYFEVKDGPYNPENDKKFASWAPAEGDPEAQAYMQRILDKLDLH